MTSHDTLQAALDELTRTRIRTARSGRGTHAEALYMLFEAGGAGLDTPTEEEQQQLRRDSDCI